MFNVYGKKLYIENILYNYIITYKFKKDKQLTFFVGLEYLVKALKIRYYNDYVYKNNIKIKKL